MRCQHHHAINNGENRSLRLNFVVSLSGVQTKIQICLGVSSSVSSCKFCHSEYGSFYVPLKARYPKIVRGAARFYFAHFFWFAMADQDQDMEPRSSPAEDAARSEEGGDFSPALRPVFLGNLTGQFQAADIRDIFERPHQPDSPEAPFDPISVERVDLKRGYCFVFLHDATSEEHKKRIQTFVNVINGM